MNRAGKNSGNTVKFLNEDFLKQIQRQLLHGPQQIAGSTYIKLYSLLNLCISQFQLRPSPPPPQANPRALALFFLGWQIPGGGDERREEMPHPRDIVAYVLNAEYIIASVYKQ